MSDLNEMAENAKRSKALDELAEISQEMEKHRKEDEARNDAWWEGLTEEEREDAFYAVCKRLHQGELKERGSYRYVLYNVSIGVEQI